MARTKSNPMNYNKCREILNGQAVKKIAGNTWIYDYGTQYVIRFHDTDIVTFFQDGSVIVRNGGYKTATTKARINEYLGLGIYQKDFVWYYGDKEFRDGMIVMNSDCS